jgi:hypothetical protein
VPPNAGDEEAGMRADDGDETVDDYAAEGRQAPGKIKGAQYPRSGLRGVARRFSTRWRGDHAQGDETG